MRTRDVTTLLLTAAFCLSGFTPSPASAATITIINADGAGEGFNDPTPATPIGGNPGTTVGAQRLFVFQHAAEIWGAILPSNIEIRVSASFDPLTCNTTSGVLGSAGTAALFRDFSGAILSQHWYVSALADKLTNSDLNPANPDINAHFNSSVGTAGCLPMGWYYGVDGNEGSQLELLPVVLHELAHGLGFATTTDSDGSGTFLANFPSVWDHYLLDNTLGMHWDQMSDLQRAASGLGCQQLVWDGTWVTHEVTNFVSPRPYLRVNAPAGIAGGYRVGVALFGPALDATGVTGNVVLADDGVANTSNGCEPFVNGAAMNGKIALIDRGTCGFTVKVKNAQNAGAIAAIVADSLPGCVAGMGGTDATITIPSVRVTQSDGALLKANLASGLNVTLINNQDRYFGADNAGRLQLYTPSTFTPGSSVSHWDTEAFPDLLMEPAINTSLSSSVDITPFLFADIGWLSGDVGTVVARFEAITTDEGVRVEWQLTNPGSYTAVALQRSVLREGPWTDVASERHEESGVTVAVDRLAAAGQSYWYRLVLTAKDGSTLTFGPVRGEAAAKAFALGLVAPNPAKGPVRVDFTVARAAPIRLTVLDVQGREVEVMARGTYPAGRYQAVWDGTDSRGAVSPGIYFVRYQAQGQEFSKPLVISR